MRYRRARATLCSLVLLTVLAGLSMTGPGPTPVAAQQATVFTTGEGLSNDLLKGWQRVQLQGQIAGRYSAVLTAPLCSSQNSVGCQSDGATTAHLISLTVERASSEATATGDELPATLDQLAFTRTAATVDGQPAIRFTAPNPDQYFSQVVVLEVEGVYYHLAFSASFQAVPQLVDQILAGFTLRPAEAPAPFIASGNTSPTPTPDPGLVNQYTVFLPTVSYANTPVQTQPAGSPASRFTVAQATGTGLSWVFNREQLAQLAASYGPLYTNPGDNYYHPTADGAHFIDCMLRASGLPGARCNGAGDSYLGMADLYTFVVGTGAEQVSNPVRGDIFFLSDGTGYCWGGVVTSVSSGIVRVAAHSHIILGGSDSFAANSLACGRFTSSPSLMTRDYLRLDAEAPSAFFLTPAAGKRHPSDTSPITYQGTDVGSGLAGFTLRYWKDGTLTVLASKTTSTSWTGGLNLPCRAVTAEVVAHDRTGNVDETRGDSRSLTILVRGDVNADGVIDPADLELLVEAEGLATGQPGFSAALDPTGDGRVDAADRLLVQRRMSETCPQP